MIANQLGRRNLSAKQISYLRGRQQQQEKQRIANPDGNNQYIEVKPQNEVQPLEPTAARLAKQHGVSKATIERDADYAKAVDAIVAVMTPEVQQQLLAIDSNLTKSATVKLAELAQEEPGVMMEVMEEIQQAPSKTAASAVVQRFKSKIEEAPVNKQTARLDDFETAGAGVNWLLEKFTATEILQWVTQNLINEEVETFSESEFFDDDEEEN
jgi:hypothetical protein